MKRLITSALPYVNNEPHLGNIVGCVLSADVFARYCRLKGYETLYVCGTDEYGTATETKARQENCTPQEICDTYYKVHQKIYQYFNISFDVFGRTSCQNHKITVQEIFHQIHDKGGFVEKEAEQLFCNDCQTFLADRLVYGNCPKCSSSSARGDQCDACSSLLTPLELIMPICGICSSKSIKTKKSIHLYLDLLKYEKQLSQWQDISFKMGDWMSNAIKTTQSWMKEGLQPRAVTRNLKWGVSVPKKGFEDKVFYVWFDAPIGYISITRDKRDDWQLWWKKPKEVELYQFMGKDNIPFHSIIFPVTQLATGDDWVKVHKVASVEYLNYENTKFSKSRHVGVFGTDVINSSIPVDLWRFYLISVRPETSDSSFSWDDFYNKVNNDFIDNIGNFINRVFVYSHKNFDGKLCEENYNQDINLFILEAKNIEKNIEKEYESCRLRNALRAILQLGHLGNRFFQEQEPWIKIKTDKLAVMQVINVLIHLIKDIAITLSPVMPETAKRLAVMLNIQQLSWCDLGHFDTLKASLLKPEILFDKLTPELIAEFKVLYGQKEKSDWHKVSLQVGEIVAVDDHPHDENFYVLQVDFAESKKRQIVARIKKYYQCNSLVGKKVIGVVNLPKAEFNNVISEAMILTVVKRKKMELLIVDGIQKGLFLQVKNKEMKNNEKLISIDEFKSLNLQVIDNTFTIDGVVIEVANQPIKTLNIVNGQVK